MRTYQDYVCLKTTHRFVYLTEYINNTEVWKEEYEIPIEFFLNYPNKLFLICVANQDGEIDYIVHARVL